MFCQLPYKAFDQKQLTTHLKVISLQPLKSEILSLLADWDSKVALKADASITTDFALFIIYRAAKTICFTISLKEETIKR